MVKMWRAIDYETYQRYKNTSISIFIRLVYSKCVCRGFSSLRWCIARRGKKETKETCKHFRETQERSHRDVFVWNGNGNEIATFKIHFLQQKKHTINGTNIYMVRISCNYSSDGHFLFAFFFLSPSFSFSLASPLQRWQMLPAASNSQRRVHSKFQHQNYLHP